MRYIIRMLYISPTLTIGDSELVERFVRSAGPGGQNVNKLATAVQLRFDVRNSPSLPDEVRTRLERIAGNLVTADGVLIIEARRFRTQERNRKDARDRLIALLRRALIPPKPRKPTRPTHASLEKRLKRKARTGLLKRSRGSSWLGEE